MDSSTVYTSTSGSAGICHDPAVAEQLKIEADDYHDSPVDYTHVCGSPIDSICGHLACMTRSEFLLRFALVHVGPERGKRMFQYLTDQGLAGVHYYPGDWVEAVTAFNKHQQNT